MDLPPLLPGVAAVSDRHFLELVAIDNRRYNSLPLTKTNGEPADIPRAPLLCLFAQPHSRFFSTSLGCMRRIRRARAAWMTM